MIRTLLAFWLTLVLITTGHAQKDRPIVYAARYYSPVSRPKVATYSHIYRINPDGTGKQQLTFAKQGDFSPKWSPDGKRILFFRADYQGDLLGHIIEEPGSPYVMNADGSNVRRLFKATVRINDSSADWVNNRTVALDFDEGKVKSVLFDVITQKRATIPDDENRFDCMMPDGNDVGTETEGNSTQGHWYSYFLLDSSRMHVKKVAEGNGLFWSPDAKRFVTTKGRDTAPYGKWSDKRERTVWVRPLLIGDAKDATTSRPLISGLVLVEGCDWRGGPTTR